MLKNLLKLIFPKLCNGCDELLLLNENVICSNCRHSLPLTNHHLILNNDTTKKFYGIINIEFGASMLYFNKEGIVQKLIHNLKYKGNENIGVFLGEWYANDLKNNKIINSVSEIIPVPLHPKRFKERGYNQVAQFAEHIASALNVKYIDNVLLKVTNTDSQVLKSRFARWTSNEELFTLQNKSTIANKHILLVDDLITTGATMEACINVLNQAENIKISVACMAIAQ